MKNYTKIQTEDMLIIIRNEFIKYMGYDIARGEFTISFAEEEDTTSLDLDIDSEYAYKLITAFEDWCQLHE